MKSSIFTDVIQMILFIGLLAFILGLLFPEMARQERSILEGSVWSWGTGLNLLLVALLQALSYGFHDPVMTDRGFLVRPKKALLAFGLAGAVGALCILCFSLTGVFAQGLATDGASPTVAVTRYFGIGMLLVVNAIMLTSAASTLDSTFTSFTKLLSRDLRLFPKAGVQIAKGRQLMAITAVLGSLPLLFSPSLLSASTISGTMVLGLGPVFLLPRKRVMHPLAFHLPVALGFLAGLAVIFAPEQSSWYFTTGPYAGLLFFNVLAFVGGFLLFIPFSYLNYDPRKNAKLATSGSR
ncbi:hypothetical protein [Nitritalea halalkaliphila]|uniref:hypothetical protein n=1 Tax=Nitritalea halalkaliphila TaxID=590849 RepID=UPI0002EFE148|nr:hypothetical protein [Nitritalea halalkaliphila]